MSLPKLPYMRPLAFSMPVEYESELTYYEYLNNLYVYINTNVRNAIDQMEYIVDDYPEMQEKVANLIPRVTALENQIVTLGDMVSGLDTLTQNHTHRLDIIDTQIGDIVDEVETVRAEVDDLLDTVSELGTTVATHTTQLATFDANLAEIGRKVNPIRLHSEDFTLGEDAWQLTDLFPSIKYSDLINKRVRILVNLTSGGWDTAPNMPTLMVGGSSNRTINLLKVTTSLTGGSTKNLVIDIDFNVVGTDLYVSVKPYSNIGMTQFYGGMMKIPNVPLNNNVTGMLSLDGIGGVGTIETFA